MKTPTNSNQAGQQARMLGRFAAASCLAFVSLPLWAASPNHVKKAPKRLPVVTAAVKSGDSAAGKQEVLKQVAHRELSRSPAPVTAPALDPPARWLRSTTSSAASEVARRLIRQASQELQVGAWLSAETSAWEALHWSAESVDLATREKGMAAGNEPTALARLTIAKHAIREARDFSGVYGTVDEAGIVRMAKSHLTDLLDHQPIQGLTAIDAADRYLDEARTQLAPIASKSDEAVRAMDLLAAIYLARADQKTFPSGTALCLRRAALQGQPDNASIASRLGVHLAAVGLWDEARWALEHSLSIQPDPATTRALARLVGRSGDTAGATQLMASAPSAANSQAASTITVPEIVQLSPSEFAAVSRPVMFGDRRQAMPASFASSRINTSAGAQPAPVVPTIDPSSEQEAASVKKPNVMRRMMNSFRSLW